MRRSSFRSCERSRHITDSIVKLLHGVGAAVRTVAKGLGLHRSGMLLPLLLPELLGPRQSRAGHQTGPIKLAVSFGEASVSMEVFLSTK